MTWPINKVHRSGRQVCALLAAWLLPIVASIAMADSIEGKVIGITDGDTFTLLTADLQQVKVRVAEIDAPERGQPYAWVYRSYSDDVALYELERAAQTERRGLWSLPEYQRVPPWNYRNGERQEVRHEGPAAAFQCGSKTYCREMVSCDEARFYLKSCGLTRLDGDGDGVPCEAVCR